MCTSRCASSDSASDRRDLCRQVADRFAAPGGLPQGPASRRYHLTGNLPGSSRDLVLAVELYVAAARNPALRAATQDWMSRGRRSLERHLDPMTAAQIRSALHRLTGR